MKKLISISFLIFFSSVYAQTVNRWEWREIAQFPAKSPRFISVSSDETFSIVDASANVFEYSHGVSSKISSPAKNNFTRPVISSAFDGKVLFAAMDKDWHTHFYLYNEKKWNKFNFVYELPIQSFVIVNPDKIYAIGNFGTLLKLDDRQWIRIETGLKTHINFYAVKSESEIYFLTKSEGLIKFDGENLKHIPINTDSLKISSIKDAGGRVIASNSFNEHFEIVDDKIVPLQKSDLPIIYNSSDVGILRLRENLGRVTNEITIPANLKIAAHFRLSRTEYLFCTTSGVVYKTVPTDRIFLFNLASQYSIATPSETQSNFGIVSDFNGDGFQDLTLGALNRTRYGILLKNNSSGPFTDVSEKLIFLRERKITQLSSVNITGEKSPNLLSVYTERTGSILSIARLSDNTYLAGTTIQLSTPDTPLPPSHIVPTDIDYDGDLDLAVTYYYGQGDNSGRVYFYKNSLFGTSWELDTSYTSVSRGWNIQSIFADFNGDERNDWLIINKWRRTRLLINYNGKFVDESAERLENNDLSEDYSAGAADFDNDGDLDIAISSDQYPLRIYINNGFARFTELEMDELLAELNSVQRISFPTALNFGDFNNDGFVDIILSMSSLPNSIKILLNENGKRFIDGTDSFAFNSSSSIRNIVADLNNDGDLDIYQLNNGKNNFWENSLNNDSFIRFNLKGSVNNPSAIGAKIELFEESGDSLSLVGFRQVGSCEFGLFTQSELAQHFGVNPAGRYSAKVKFYAGDSVLVKNISPGKTIQIFEKSDAADFISRIPLRAFLIASNRSIQIYFAAILISVIIIFFGLRFSARIFKWQFGLTMFFGAMNLSLVWLIVVLTIQMSSGFVKFIMPVAVAFGSTILPFFVFLFTRKSSPTDISKARLEEEYLQLQITFSHGEWALRNINSLQLYLQNFSRQNLSSEKFVEQFSSRLSTFSELTKVSLNRLIELNSLLNKESGESIELSRIFSSVELFIAQIQERSVLLDTPEYMFKDCANSLSKLKELLSSSRKQAYTSFSCSPVRVIRQFGEENAERLKEHNIDFSIDESIPNSAFALIRNHELMEILENLMNNSMRALTNTAQKQIKISVFRSVPKTQIEFFDNGCGIPAPEWEDIFGRGYSKNRSTGEGLYLTRKLVEKYGGRIYVKSSRENNHTKLLIELNEGIGNETAITDN